MPTVLYSQQSWGILQKSYRHQKDSDYNARGKRLAECLPDWNTWHDIPSLKVP